MRCRLQQHLLPASPPLASASAAAELHVVPPGSSQRLQQPLEHCHSTWHDAPEAHGAPPQPPAPEGTGPAGGPAPAAGSSGLQPCRDSAADQQPIPRLPFPAQAASLAVGPLPCVGGVKHPCISSACEASLRSGRHPLSGLLLLPTSPISASQVCTLLASCAIAPVSMDCLLECACACGGWHGTLPCSPAYQLGCVLS